MRDSKYQIIKMIPDSKISDTWMSYLSILETAIHIANDLKRNWYLTEQILINYSRAMEETTVNRSKKFVPRIKQMEDHISIINLITMVEVYQIRRSNK
jgi:hypothetical protein